MKPPGTYLRGNVLPTVVVVSVVMLSPNTMNEFAKSADVSLVGGTPQNAMVRPSALRYG